MTHSGRVIGGSTLVWSSEVFVMTVFNGRRLLTATFLKAFFKSHTIMRFASLSRAAQNIRATLPVILPLYLVVESSPGARPRDPIAQRTIRCTLRIRRSHITLKA